MKTRTTANYGSGVYTIESLQVFLRLIAENTKDEEGNTRVVYSYLDPESMNRVKTKLESEGVSKDIIHAVIQRFKNAAGC